MNTFSEVPLQKENSPIVQKIVFSILFSISFAHLLNDLIQAIIPSVYPILKQNYHLSFSQIGLITFAFQLTASIFQPFVGYYTDKYPKPFSQIYGMLFSLAGIISLSFADNFYWIMFSVCLIGTGSSIFHPESARISNLASGGRRGLAQSIFQVGGNLGTALGPLLVALIVVPNSQKYILWFVIAAVIGLAIISKIAYWYKDHLILRNQKSTVFVDFHNLPKRKVQFSIAILLIVIFSKFFYTASLSTYYIFYVMDKFNLSIRQAQFHMFIYLIAYAIGTIIPNTASIYFDTNPAIDTGICNTEFVATLGNSNSTFETLKYYPNPVRKSFYISNKSTIEKIEVNSIVGQVITRKEVNDLQTEIDLSSLTNGVYFITVTSQNENKIIKIIKE